MAALMTKRRAQMNGARDARAILEKYVYGTATFMEIPVDDLIIDPSYQREQAETLVNKIVAHFDENKFEPPTVNWRPNNELATVDGGHRVSAAKRLGLKTITCRVVEIDPADEPALFIEMNRNRRWVTPVQTFKAELEAKNPAALEIARVLGMHGLRVSSHRSPDTLSCTKTLHRIYSSGGSPLLERIILVAKAWSDDEPRRFAGELLTGIQLFLESRGTVDEGRLHDRLSRIAPGHLLANASQTWHAWRSLDQRGGSKVEAIAEEIRKQYAKR